MGVSGPSSFIVYVLIWHHPNLGTYFSVLIRDAFVDATYFLASIISIRTDTATCDTACHHAAKTGGSC